MEELEIQDDQLEEISEKSYNDELNNEDSNNDKPSPREVLDSVNKVNKRNK